MSRRGGGGVRHLRIQSDIQRNVSQLISRDIRDARVQDGYPIISEVVLTPDLSQAKIYISFMNEDLSPNDKLEAIRILQDSAGYFRSRLAQSIRGRSVPKIKFFYDDYSDQMHEMDQAVLEEKREIERIKSRRDTPPGDDIDSSDTDSLIEPTVKEDRIKTQEPRDEN